MDVVEEQRLLRGLLDASTTELQVQARDLAALATDLILQPRFYGKL
jgi:hypothetical protein